MDEGFGSRRRYRYSGRGEARVCPSFRLPAFTVKEHSNAFTQDRGKTAPFHASRHWRAKRAKDASESVFCFPAVYRKINRGAACKAAS